MRSRQIITYLILLWTFVLKSQTDFCECCSYHSLQYHFTDYENIFPPDLIAKNIYKELIVYASGRLRDDTIKADKIKVRKTLIPDHREMKFYFDSKGFVSFLTLYNQMGKPHSAYKFDRNASGKLTKLTFAYIDSLENIVPNFGSETTVYIYDIKNNLVKQETLGSNGEDLPDNKSKYTKYAYDAKNRIVQEVSYTYYDKKSIYTHTTNIKYSDNNFTAESSTSNDGKEWLTRTYSYNSEWKLTGEKSFYAKTKKTSSDLILKYNPDNQLLSYWLKTNGGTECPETNGFVDLYFYMDSKLIDRIAHNFNNYTCEMTFEYKK